MAGVDYQMIDEVQIGGVIYQVFYNQETNGELSKKRCPTCGALADYLAYDYTIVEVRHARLQDRKVRVNSDLWRKIEKAFLVSPNREEERLCCDVCIEANHEKYMTPSLVENALNPKISLEEIAPDSEDE